MALYSYKTSNPAFSREVWKGYASTSNKMTVNGIILKSFFCLLLVASTTYLTWEMVAIGYNIKLLMYGGLVGTIFFSLITAFVHRLAPLLVPLYALSLGFFLGGITIYAEAKFKGMPMQAIGVTISTFFVMLFLYKSKIIKVTERFRSVLIVAITIIMAIYALSWLLHFFDIETPFTILDSSSYLAVGFNVIGAGIAAFTLLLDFDFIERKKNHVPRYMEWVATWGLLVTLVWVYVEAFRMMKKIAMN
jgi:uncharacterized YccA/Bax inhibitor family protein